MSGSTSVQSELIGVNFISISIPFSTSIPPELMVWGGQIYLLIHLLIHIHVLPVEGPLDFQFQSHICLTLGEGGSTPSSGSSSIQSELIV